MFHKAKKRNRSGWAVVLLSVVGNKKKYSSYFLEELILHYKIDVNESPYSMAHNYIISFFSIFPSNNSGIINPREWHSKLLRGQNNNHNLYLRNQHLHNLRH